jgi:hypothetical protein
VIPVGLLGRDRDRVNNVLSLWAPSAAPACDWAGGIWLVGRCESCCCLPAQTRDGMTLVIQNCPWTAGRRGDVKPGESLFVDETRTPLR